ncbi:MAG: hypothetical protein ACI9XB_000598 [Gammaproteobacteria bacterium]
MKFLDNIVTNQRQWIIRLIVGCILLQLFLTSSLWWSAGRTFPTVPFFNFMPPIAYWWFQSLLPWLFVINLLLVLIFPKIKKGLLLVITLAILLILFDVNRLQVWMYQWFCMLTVLYFSTKESTWKSCLQFMLMALYFWSGFNKLSIPYLEHSFPYLMDAFSITKPIGDMKAMAIISALIEMGIGIGLFFQKSRNIALWIAILMHLLILLILGPFGANVNEVVWPWNIAMIFIVLLLFHSAPFSGLSHLWKRSFLIKIIMIFWGLMPLGNVFNIWDEQLSFKMYSGTNPEGMLIDRSISKDCFPDSLKVYYTRNGFEEAELILIDDWALKELKAPPYVSERTLKQIAKKWCSCLAEPEKGTLEIMRVWRWSGKERENLRVDCVDLLRAPSCGLR